MRVTGRLRAPVAATVGLMAGTLLLGACGSDPDESSAVGAAATPPASTSPAEPSSPSSTAPSGSSPQASVPRALAFRGTTVAGKDFDAATLAGKPVVVWFWAPWCAVCRSQVPMVADLAEEYAGRVSVIGIGSLDGGDAIADFADDVPGITHLSDPDGALWRRFGVTEQSSFVVLDAEGEEALRTGYSDDDELADVVADVAAG